MPHVLIVDDDKDARELLAEMVSGEGFTTATAATLREARQRMAVRQPDVVLLDLVLPDGSGMDLFEDVDARAVTEVVLITGHATLETSVEALRLGAADYLVKPIHPSQVKAILARVERPADLKADIDSLRREMRNLGRFGKLIGTSATMQTLYDQIGRVAPTLATVLIAGESGSGKELVAQTIHELSLRRKQPFLAINCGAIPSELIESEMFGHEKGSFTGATREHRGYFERAHSGSLFLDEVTEMPLALQVKLLRVLETGTFMRIGSQELQSADVRILAATNRDPAEAVASGKLREDLYYRLNVFPIYVPPLRERAEDVPLLAQHFLDLLNHADSLRKKLSPQAIEKLCAYDWPGNVRELKNVINRIYIMESEDLIGASHLPSERGASPASRAGLELRVGMTIAEAERRLILATIEHCKNREKAATTLGISLKTLYNRLHEYGDAADRE